MRKDNRRLIPETKADWLMLKAVVADAHLPMSIKRLAEVGTGVPATHVHPHVLLKEGSLPEDRGIERKIICEYELPYEGTLFGMPRKERVLFTAAVEELYESELRVRLTFLAARPEFQLMDSDIYATLPWNSANSTVIVAVWDESKKESHPLD